MSQNRTDVYESYYNCIENEMRQVFGSDEKRINHALRVYEYADRIGTCEDLDWHIIIAAALLHDIGIKAAEKKYNSASGKYQEIEGPPIAEKILEKLDVEPDLIEHICAIIANHHSDKGIDTPEFRIIWDADWCVNLLENPPFEDTGKLRKLVEKIFKTEAGRKTALALLD